MSWPGNSEWRPAAIGQLYRLLRQLEATGLMSSDWEHLTAGPSRRVYSASR
jgi:DNA-binding PadR family transcriptional regulator